MIGNPNNARREAVRAAQDRERGGMTPADWDAAEPAIEAERRRELAAAEWFSGLCACGVPERSCVACTDAIGGP